MRLGDVYKSIAIFGCLLAGCQSSQDPSSDTSSSINSSSRILIADAGPNVIPIQIGGAGLCATNGYVNEPCVSVTICVPGTQHCQTISDILIDTGSYGLRIFSSAISLSLPDVTDSNGHTMGECALFGTGSDWGKVVQANVILGTEPAVTTSIQAINSGFASIPSICDTPDTSPTQAGFNGILGVGLFKQDCGAYCEQVSDNQMYYSCVGTNCSSISVPLDQQLQNPVSLLKTDGNGVIVEMPLLDSGGDSSVAGALVLGIGTETNNMPDQETAFSADAYGNFTTVFNGERLDSSFIDSGSNGLFFPATSTLPVCSYPGTGFFCPSSTLSFVAQNRSADQSIRQRLSFQIANANDFFTTGYYASDSLGGDDPNGFDWGLPFFFGRKVYIGIENTVSSFGTGPYWAY